MLILSHRGCWKSAAEKNSKEAFITSFEQGFGVETDVRDYCGELVISHDIPTASCMSLRAFLEIYQKFGGGVTLALNIKSEGLQDKLKELLINYKVERYFVFDMSIPETLKYFNAKFKVFSRQSEYELQPFFYEVATGVWVDQFRKNWFAADDIISHLSANKKVCLVSPELHGRDPHSSWELFKDIDRRANVDGNLMICTDIPQTAKVFFGDEN